MKRMIIVSAFLAAIVGLGIAESVISSSLYRRLSAQRMKSLPREMHSCRLKRKPG